MEFRLYLKEKSAPRSLWHGKSTCFNKLDDGLTLNAALGNNYKDRGTGYELGIYYKIARLYE